MANMSCSVQGDNNILRRFIKPAARTMGLPWVNWRCLRTSHAVGLKLAGADIKDAQGQMRFDPETAQQIRNVRLETSELRPKSGQF
jgi:hypothetical protein